MSCAALTVQSDPGTGGTPVINVTDTRVNTGDDNVQNNNAFGHATHTAGVGHGGVIFTTGISLK